MDDLRRGEGERRRRSWRGMEGGGDLAAEGVEGDGGAWRRPMERWGSSSVWEKREADLATDLALFGGVESMRDLV